MTTKIASKCPCGSEFVASSDSVAPLVITTLYKEWQQQHAQCFHDVRKTERRIIALEDRIKNLLAGGKL